MVDVCKSCGKTVESLRRCGGCKKIFCERCSYECDVCDKVFYDEHIKYCEECEKYFCAKHSEHEHAQGSKRVKGVSETALIVIGIILTFTIIGAIVGIPLIIIGILRLKEDKQEKN